MEKVTPIKDKKDHTYLSGGGFLRNKQAFTDILI